MAQSNKPKEPIKVEVDDRPVVVQSGKNETDIEKFKLKVYDGK